MERLGAGDAIVVVLSNAYLESENCMFELTEIAARGDSADAFTRSTQRRSIFRPERSSPVYEYWARRVSELKPRHTVSPAHTTISKDFARYRMKSTASSKFSPT